MSKRISPKRYIYENGNLIIKYNENESTQVDVNKNIEYFIEEDSKKINILDLVQRILFTIIIKYFPLNQMEISLMILKKMIQKKIKVLIMDMNHMIIIRKTKKKTMTIIMNIPQILKVQKLILQTSERIRDFLKK